MGEIDELEGNKLNLAICKVLGYQCCQFISPGETWYQLFAPQESASRSRAELLGGALLDYEQWDTDDLINAANDLPAWTDNIAQAWELDDVGWCWSFVEYCRGLRAILETPINYVRVGVDWADFPTKAAAYATARCRAFLKAMGATQ